MVNVWLLNVSLSFRLFSLDGILFSACVYFVQFVSSLKNLLSECLREIFICEFKFVRWSETNLNFNVLLQLLYLLLQSVADSMVVAVAFPDFSGFLAFRAPNIWLPKSGSNGSFLELIFLVLTWIRGICLLVHKVLSTTLGSDPVHRIWLCP